VLGLRQDEHLGWKHVMGKAAHQMATGERERKNWDRIRHILKKPASSDPLPPTKPYQLIAIQLWIH
jgi:hypothetical protein